MVCQTGRRHTAWAALGMQMSLLPSNKARVCVLCDMRDGSQHWRCEADVSAVCVLRHERWRLLQAHIGGATSPIHTAMQCHDENGILLKYNR